MSAPAAAMLVAGHTPVETAISGASGTAIGDYTTRTSAIRDGTTSQAAAVGGASGNVGTVSRFGVDYGSGVTKVFSGVEFWGCNDVDLNNGNAGSTSATLKASNTDPTTNSWTGTTIGSISAFTTAAGDHKSSLGNSNATGYRYAWLEITFAGSSAAHALAEVKFYEWL